MWRGAQVHAMWDGSDADDRRELDLLRDAGADVVRLDVSWAGIEPRPGARDPGYLARLDAFVEAADERGLRVLPVLLTTPCWAARDPRGCTEPYDEEAAASPPRDPQAFARVAAFVADRYGDRLAAIELWNEPNLPSGRFWRSERPAQEYAALVRAAAPAVQQAAPQVPVLAGAIALADRDFLAAMLRAGLGDAVDGISVHPYTGDRPPAGLPAALRGLRALAGRDLWLTEAGASSCARGSGWACVGPEGQAAYLRDLLALDLPGVRAVVVYGLRDKDEAGVEGGFGLVRRDFGAKPALRSFTRALGRHHVAP